MSNDNKSITNLGFLSLHETAAKDGYLGSILITDNRGVPLEFRCTLPVKPTAAQKPLYGNTLIPHIGINLCGIPLIKSIQNSPSLIVVQKDFLLDVRSKINCAVAYVRRAGETIDVSSSDDSKANTKRERIDSSTGKFQPIVLTTHPEFEEDKSYAKEIIENVFVHLDPLEPFDRMKKAIGLLSKQDKKFE